MAWTRQVQALDRAEAGAGLLSKASYNLLGRASISHSTKSTDPVVEPNVAPNKQKPHELSLWGNDKTKR